MRLMMLSEMLTELRLEARISSDVAHGTHLQNRYIGLLRRVQEEVYHAYDWPNLNFTQDKVVSAGQRYAEFPSAFDLEGIRAVFQLDASGQWSLPLEYGIGAQELNHTDSAVDARDENIWKWQPYLSPAAEQVNLNMFEVWPIPNREVTLRFEGKRKLFPLSNPDTDRSTVDGIIVVLHAAAELLAGNKAEDAALKIQKAQQRFDLMRQRTSAPNRNKIIPNGGSASAYNPQRFRVR